MATTTTVSWADIAKKGLCATCKLPSASCPCNRIEPVVPVVEKKTEKQPVIVGSQRKKQNYDDEEECYDLICKRCASIDCVCDDLSFDAAVPECDDD